MNNIVAIVGRPNVGKSTLFNRLTESRQAIVKEISGVTRDRIYGHGEWNGVQFSVIDTGGYARGSDDIFEGEIRKQAEIAIEEANAIIFMVDVTTGITELDQIVSELLRKSNKKIFIAANKVDNTGRIGLSAEFWSLGIGEVYDISAVNGGGTGELLDDLIKAFDKDGGSIRAHDDLPHIAVVGKPNVGKSSFINALTGEDRAIENSDVCVFMIDAEEGIQKQDLNIFYIIEKNSKGVVVLVNKWDLIEKDHKTTLEFEEKIREQLAPFNDVPIVFTSTVTKQRIHKALESAMEVYENRTMKIPTSKLNDVMLEVIQTTPPPSVKGKYVKIKFVQQLPTHAPSFAFFCNLPQYIPDSYKRFLENRLREIYNFTGVPIKIFFRRK